MITTELIPILKDNYCYLLTEESGAVALVDPGLAAPVIKALEEKNLRPDYILNTHHHADHTGGNSALKEKYGCKIAGPAPVPGSPAIAELDITLGDGDRFRLGDSKARIIATPGHTADHISFWFPDSAALFCGDVLFSIGCGRLFEGTAAQMWESLSKLAALPDETQIYCGHEYTLANGTFCQTIEPDNKALQERMEQVKTLRAQNLPTIPSTIGQEKQTNAFLRAGSVERFAALRAQKDAA